ncbi:hypothetical protein I4U23_022783 [Adineta vaga]|nr:hypothetical protein I4U23_022783 [Adineta vaga]
MAGNSDTGVCGFLWLTCFRLAPCEAPANSCQQTDHICVRHPRCNDRPIDAVPTRTRKMIEDLSIKFARYDIIEDTEASNKGNRFMGENPVSVTTADINGDNNIDIIVANSGADDVGVLEGGYSVNWDENDLFKQTIGIGD